MEFGDCFGKFCLLSPHSHNKSELCRSKYKYIRVQPLCYLHPYANSEKSTLASVHRGLYSSTLIFSFTQFRLPAIMKKTRGRACRRSPNLALTTHSENEHEHLKTKGAGFFEVTFCRKEEDLWEDKFSNKQRFGVPPFFFLSYHVLFQGLI